MKIVVFIRSALDTKVPLECVEPTQTLKQDWNVSMLHPDDEAALAAAVQIKQQIPGTRITAVLMGPQSEERFIRDALAGGCDEGLRIWEEGLRDIGSEGKALILSRVGRILGFDLLATGAGSPDPAAGQIGVLLASRLQVPCLTRVIRIDAVRKDCIVATRNLDQGFRQRVESVRPLVITVEEESEAPINASYPAVAQAYEREIPCFDLARIGMPRRSVQEADSHLDHGPLRFPSPGLQFVQPPDSSLPAFERRLQLGRCLADRRAGNIAECDGDTAAEEIFRILLRGGWLNHLRKNDRGNE